MVQEAQEKKVETKKWVTSHCHHGGDTFSIGIEVQDCHVDLTTNAWSFKPGNHAKVTFFDTTSHDYLMLIDKLAQEALKILPDTASHLTSQSFVELGERIIRYGLQASLAEKERAGQ